MEVPTVICVPVELWAREALARCQQASWAILVGVWMTKFPRQTEDSRSPAPELQTRIRTQLETGLKAICMISWQGIWLHLPCVENLSEAEHMSNERIHLVKEISI